MEEVSNTETWEDIALQPDLLEDLGEQEATAFGMHGKLKDLAKLCPVDLSDPRITLEAKNEFVVKLANESGMEIDPKYENLFDRVLTERGLDRKFTIAPVAKDTLPEPESDNVARAERSQRGAMPHTEKFQPHASLRDQAQNTFVTEQLDEQLHMRQSVEIETQTDSPAPISLPVPDRALKIIENPKQTEEVPELSAETPQSLELSPEDLVLPEVVQAEVGPIFSDETSPLTTEVNTSVAWAPEAVQEESSEMSAQEETLEQTISSWEAVLYEEPLQTYDDFSNALLVFIEARKESTVQTADENIALFTSLSAKNEQSETQAVPPIITTVAERLTQLEEDEKEAVAVTLQKIVGAVHGLHILELREAPIEVIEATKMQLEQLCIELFESLGIDYTTEDIEQFMAVLCSPEFQPAQTEIDLQTVDLESDGMHNAKLRAPQLATNPEPTSLNHLLHQALGAFAASFLYAPLAA